MSTNRKIKIAAIVAAIVVVISCIIITGWTPIDAVMAAKRQVAATDDNAANTFHDYTEEGVVANGNRMPDGTVVNPWIATEGLSGQERVDAVYAELLARTDPQNSNRPSAALLAELALDAENRTSNKGHTLGVTILDRNQNAAMADRPNEAQRDFWRNRDYAIEAFAKLKAIWESAEEVYVENLNGYESSFYMVHNGWLIDGELSPLVVARHSHNAGGHFICFKVRIKDTDEYVVLRYRLECGFQPIEPEYFPVPNVPPVPDNPEPPTPTPEPPTPTPTPPTPTPTPLESKNPDGGTGGGPNADNRKTDTTEPNTGHSPDEYIAPAPPSEDKPSGGDSPTEKPDASSGTRSGSQTVDHDNGRQETYTDPDTGAQDTGTVQAGDGRDHGDFAQQVDDHPATVEQHADPAPTTDNPSPGNDECEAPE